VKDGALGYINFVELLGLRGEPESIAREGIYRVQSVPGFGAQLLSKAQVFLTRTPYEEVLRKIQEIDEHNMQLNLEYSEKGEK
jgi:hypothetical protein